MTGATMKLVGIDNVFGIYCDAWVTDDLGMLIFASLWGRDIAIQELLAKLTLQNSMDGIDQLHLNNEGVLRIGNPERLDKLTGRMPKANLFGDMVQLWLFDRAVVTPDLVNHRAYWLVPSKAKVDLDQGTWALTKRVCHLPLLDAWQKQVNSLCIEHGWLKTMQGHGAFAIFLEFPEKAFDEAIENLIHSGKLAL
jgi:hypothetical protein